MFSCEILENIKKVYLKNICEKLLLSVSEKKVHCFYQWKAMLDGKRRNWATNAFQRKYEPYEVSLCNIHVIPIAFCYFLQASEESKSDNG